MDKDLEDELMYRLCVREETDVITEEKEINKYFPTVGTDPFITYEPDELRYEVHTRFEYAGMVIEKETFDLGEIRYKNIAESFIDHMKRLLQYRSLLRGNYQEDVEGLIIRGYRLDSKGNNFYKEDENGKRIVITVDFSSKNLIVRPYFSISERERDPNIQQVYEYANLETALEAAEDKIKRVYREIEQFEQLIEWQREEFKENLYIKHNKEYERLG